MNFETRWNVTEAEYIEMIKLKTSVLLGFALELGGIIAGADANSTQHLLEGGIHIGIGFQLKDDLKEKINFYEMNSICITNSTKNIHTHINIVIEPTFLSII